MRRIYDSEALERDDEEPHAPRERRRRSYAPRAIRSVNLGALFGRLLPQRLRRRAIRVDVSTPRESYAVGEPVPFTVELRNVAPVPVAIRTPTPVAWTWAVDGYVEASHVAPWDPPAEPGTLAFGRGERKRFDREWSGLFRVADDEWEPAEPGDHRLGVAVGVEPVRDVEHVGDPASIGGDTSLRDDDPASGDGDPASTGADELAFADGDGAHERRIDGDLGASTTVRIVEE